MLPLKTYNLNTNIKNYPTQYKILELKNVGTRNQVPAEGSGVKEAEGRKEIPGFILNLNNTLHICTQSAVCTRLPDRPAKQQ